MLLVQCHVKKGRSSYKYNIKPDFFLMKNYVCEYHEYFH